ncbi:PAS domain-containing sensor histidine kinase [Clostridium sp. DJ247]|uniref:PAS domain-containing sensor histidine kinase n=1 Tax=Clostridium sp. DJ247 TaxID=2726188 RepID=UPI00162423B9|nr:PAS domain-containing sensor histidine kinase [Clostridium sp. DJ247]MBC2582411.1 PAS domain-containing protein [Clostridium sp. DJ247]
MKTFSFENTLNFLPCIKTLNGKIISINSTFINFTGYSEKDILNKYILDVFNLLRINLNSSLSSINLEKDYFLFTKTFEAKQVNISIIKNKSIDETKYIFMEKSNFNINEKFPLFSALCSDNVLGVAIYSVPDKVLLKANQTYLDFLDKPFNDKKNSFGKKIYEFVSGWLGSRSEKIWDTLLSTGKAYNVSEYAYHSFERGTIYWSGTLVPIFENNQLKYVIEMTSDITETVLNRKLIEEQSKIIFQQNQELKAVIENISGPVITVDKSGNYSMLNNSAKKFFPNVNRIGDSYKFANFYNLQGTEEPLKKCLQQLGKTKKVTYINNFKAAIDNKISYMNLMLQPLLDCKGNIKEVLLIGVDITREVKKCKELEAVLKMQEEFFSFISHEFKTPLTVSMSAIQIIELVYKDHLSENMKKYLGKIKQSSLQQLRLVNNLLDITRAEAGYLKIHKKNDDIVVMTKAITDSISLYASQKNIKLHFSSSIPSLVMAIDDEKFERILLNLLSNAIKFTPEGKSVYINVSQRRNNICIRVTDEGVGIPREKQKIIFDRFGQVNNNLTRKAEGTGIGLCLVKLLVNNLGGEISVESVEGEGSSFEISLPVTNIVEDNIENSKFDLMDNRLIHTVNVEFSNIYFG